MLAWVRRRQPIDTVMLAAFGKHPAWDDHIDNLGQQNERILAFQRAVYHQGIAAHVNAGTWDRMQDDERLEGFDYWLCSYRLSNKNSNALVGRMWSSSDGKGRKRYPMIACIDCGQMSLQWAFRFAMVTLAQVAQECIESTSAEQVRQVIHHASQRLSCMSDSLANPSATKDPWAHTDDITTLLTSKSPADFGQDGMSRIIYQAQRDLPSYMVNSNREDKATPKRSSLLRVPRCVECPREATEIWLRFAMNIFKPGSPVMILAPINHRWVDLLVGEPIGPLLWCLRAGLSSIPLTTTIPYEIKDQPSIPR